MAFCTKCGAEIAEGNKFCTACGAPVEAEPPKAAAPDAGFVQSEPAPAAQPPQPPQYNAPAYGYAAQNQNTGWQQPPQYQAPPSYYDNGANLPEQRAAVSIGQFIGCFFLFAIPIVGFIVAIVWACGGIKNKTLVNYARAMLIMIAIAVVITIIFAVIAAITGADFLRNLRGYYY